jgi:hypothetical protein
MAIPLFDVLTPLQPLRESLLAAAATTLERGSFILGPEVDAFEREFADYLGVKHVVGVANGTDALTIALRAMGVGPGMTSSCRRSLSTRPQRQSHQRARARCSATSTVRR